MGLSRSEYWSGLPFPSSGDLPNQGIETGSHALQADSLGSEPRGLANVCGMRRQAGGQDRHLDPPTANVTLEGG